MGMLVLVKTVVVHLDFLAVHVPAVVFPQILDVVVPRLHIRAAGNLRVKLLKRGLANFRDQVVDGQLDKPQVLRGKVISVVSSLKNFNGFFAVRHSTLPVSIPPFAGAENANGERGLIG
jgi:hypothetical protein